MSQPASCWPPSRLDCGSRPVAVRRVARDSLRPLPLMITMSSCGAATSISFAARIFVLVPMGRQGVRLAAHVQEAGARSGQAGRLPAALHGRDERSRGDLPAVTCSRHLEFFQPTSPRLGGFCGEDGNHGAHAALEPAACRAARPVRSPRQVLAPPGIRKIDFSAFWELRMKTAQELRSGNVIMVGSDAPSSRRPSTANPAAMRRWSR